MTAVCLGVATMLLAVSTRANDQARSPRGTPPQFVRAAVDRAGNLEYVQVVTAFVKVQVALDGPGGKGTVYRLEQRPLEYPDTRRVAAGGYQVYDTDGRKVDPKTLPRLPKKTRVLLSTDGRKVDPWYLKRVQKGTLILVIPPRGEGPKN